MDIWCQNWYKQLQSEIRRGEGLRACRGWWTSYIHKKTPPLPLQWSTHLFPNIWWKRAVLLIHIESTKLLAQFINDILIMLAGDS